MSNICPHFVTVQGDVREGAGSAPADVEKKMTGARLIQIHQAQMIGGSNHCTRVM